MSLKQYLDHMEAVGLDRNMVRHALLRHARHIEEHGLAAGIHADQTATDHWEARKYGMECRRMVEADIHDEVLNDPLVRLEGETK
jgi:hypothetical protein